MKTDPLKVDTDKNGIVDYDEDYDGDSLTNGQEFALGTSPILKDSDYDFLDDNMEVDQYGTDPIKEDTDEDGASDGWEVRNGFDPLKFNKSFAVSVDAEEPTEATPVVAGVRVSLSGKATETLEVREISSTEGSAFTPFVAGYLGSAYEFTVDGSFSTAELEFRYDKSLGDIGEEFQPRIYYYNETEESFEELPNQTVTDGCVTADVTHFSSYVLLNKVEFDKVWETEIRPPSANEENTNLDIVFVIDYSYSMVKNDANQSFKTLVKDFVSKLRDAQDRASVVKFIRQATLVSGLTADKTVVSNAIDSISYDNGQGIYSGTDGSTGIRKALDELAASDAGFKYIIHITDGEDTQNTYSYDSLIAEATSNDIVIYTIGMGSASESLLKKIAAGTNGKYYHATTGSSSEEVGLEDVFKEIEDAAIESTTDSNNDGISDYHTRLIYEGKLLVNGYSREYMGYDFNYNPEGELSSDADGDGVKNGKELLVITKKNDDGSTETILKKKSDSLMKHSDMDGVRDDKELLRGTDPLVAEYDGNAVHSLTNPEGYYDRFVELYKNDFSFRKEQQFFALLMQVGSLEEVTAETIIDYFYQYSSNELFIYLSVCELAELEAEESDKIIAKLQEKIEQNCKSAALTEESADAEERLAENKKAAAQIAELKDIRSENNRLVSGAIEGYGNGSQSTLEALENLLASDFLKAIEQVENIVDISEISFDMDWNLGETFYLYDMIKDIVTSYSTLAKAQAAKDIFAQNRELAIAMVNVCEDKESIIGILNAIDALEAGEEDFNQRLMIAVSMDSTSATLQYLVTTAQNGNPVIAGLTLGKIILGIFGADEQAANIYKSLCYTNMIQATDALCKDHFKQKRVGNYYYYYYMDDSLTLSDGIRNLTHAAQVYALGEKTFVELAGKKETAGYAQSNIDLCLEYADTLNLPISSKLIDRVS